MLRLLRLATAVGAALVVTSCCILPTEREPASVYKAVLTKPPTMRPRSAATVPRQTAVVAPRQIAVTVPREVAVPAPRSAIVPAALVVPEPSPGFPIAACIGPRVGKGQVEGGKVVGGWEGSIGDWPGFVALRVRTQAQPQTALYFCGGSAIAPRWVVTAAHCVHKQFDGMDGRGLHDLTKEWSKHGLVGPGTFEVVTRADHLATPSDPRAVAVTRVIEHPGYNDNTVVNDIALIELADPLPGPYARLSLSAATDPSDILPMRSMVAGFGSTVATKQSLQRFPIVRGGAGLALSPVLQETTVPTGRRASCAIGADQLCAAEARYGGRDSCNGDSGGPLVLFDRDKCPYVVGLTSYGPKSCGVANSFGIYTRTSSFAPWIRGYVPGVTTTPAPVDRVSLESTYRSVWASVAQIERTAAALPPSQRAAVALCKREGPGCVPRGDGPLLDGEEFRIEASTPVGSFGGTPGASIVILAVSARGIVHQVHPVDDVIDTAPKVTAAARANWSFDAGRIIILSVAGDAQALPEIARARDAEGKVADPVAYMKEVEATARLPSTAIGIMELSVRQ